MSTPVKRPLNTPLTPRGPGSSLQIVFGSILAISLLLAINFSGRIAAGRRIESERDKLQSTITSLQAQATALQGELNFVSSNAYIEQWARKEGRMVKGDEVLVIPVPGPSTPQPSPTPLLAAAVDTQKPTTENWKLWWQLFFDSPPPEGGG